MSTYDFSLSASKLSLFKECRRCFWDYCINKIPQPKGKFPSLPNGLDRVVKVYADQFRGSLPPVLQGTIEGVLWGGIEEIKKKRTWQSNTKPCIQTPGGVVSLINAFDDLVLTPRGTFAICDWKSKGDAPKSGYAEQYYQVQSDTYHVHIQASGMQPDGRTHFVFWYPQAVLDPQDIHFGVDVQTIESSYERGYELICQAVECLRGGQPDYTETCELCHFAQQRVEAVLACVNPN